MNVKKVLLYGVVIGMITGGAVVYYVFHKPHRDISDEKCITISAGDLFKAYNANEKKGDTLYLNKPLEVTGVVAEVKENQEHKTTILFQTDDPMSGVFCTMADSAVKVEIGKTVCIKGYCSGFISDVKITGCKLK
jgi:hypothetical protein